MFQGNMAACSVMEWFESNSDRGHHCGYCDSAHGSLTHGMWGHRLQPGHYAQLLNRGWRRSGKFLYHPVMDETCCPQYAIRLKVNEFKPTKSQKKVIRKVNKFLMYGKQPSHQDAAHASGDDEAADGKDGGTTTTTTKPIDAVPRPRQSPERLSLPNSQNLHAEKSASSTAQQQQTWLSSENESRNNKKSRRDAATKFGVVHDHEVTQPVNIRVVPSRFAGKSLLSSSGSSPASPVPVYKKNRTHPSLCGQINGNLSVPSSSAPSLGEVHSMHTAKQHGNGEKTLQELFAVPEEGSVSPLHRLELRLVRTSPPSASFKATLEEEYAVYAKYESAVHNRPQLDLNKRQFTRFLIDSPLVCEFHPRQRSSSSSSITSALFSGEEPLLGSYHQQYVLDGRIIAVDVIDILPGCVTSVYFFYDPDYSFLSLGTYSVLREAALVHELNQYFPDIEYISLGYYVHSCSKMQYKSRFYPSELLCPETYTWHPIEACLPLLELAQYQRFASPLVRDDEGDRSTATNVLVFFQSMPVPYPVYQNCLTQLGGDSSASLTEVRTYAKLVGRTLAGEMLLFREVPPLVRHHSSNGVRSGVQQSSSSRINNNNV